VNAHHNQSRYEEMEEERANATTNHRLQFSIPELDEHKLGPKGCEGYGCTSVGSNYKKSYRNLLKKEQKSTKQHETWSSRELNRESDDDNSPIKRAATLTEVAPLLPVQSLPKRILDSPPSDISVLSEMVFANYMNILLIFVPLAFIANHLSWSAQPVFWVNFLAMVPLACLLGDLTEEVALHTNQTIGGLINATFGNAVEVVVAIQALAADEYRIVQASMIGSIYSNLLLVLGCSFFFGGLKHKEQTFNHMVATANMSLLCLSSIAFVIPTPFTASYGVDTDDVLIMSRTVAIALILMYVQLLIFQLKTHRDDFDDEEEEEKPEMSLKSAMLYLAMITILISILSGFLVGSIDGFCTSTGVSKTFVGLIILPVVGNAVEHMTAVRSAMNNKMDLAMGVAVGSSTQISLFVAPLTVIIGWYMGKPMTLNFPQYEIVLYVLSVLVVAICTAYPRSNWLEGSVLITTYCLIALGFWYEKVDETAI